MAGCSYRFVDRIIPVLGVMAILVASLPQTAHAGLFRMLLGGGNGAQQQRDWTHVTSRKLVPFSRNYETGTKMKK
jgi:hypothetical protein